MACWIFVLDISKPKNLNQHNLAGGKEKSGDNPPSTKGTGMLNSKSFRSIGWPQKVNINKLSNSVGLFFPISL